MIRSMILAVALAGAVGCVAQDDETASVEQHTTVAGFNCQNKASISGVQCVSIPVNILNIDVKNVGVLDNSKLNILSNDLNGLSIGDINILNGNNVLNDVVDVTKNDFLNKFNISVAKNNVSAVVSVLGLGICK